MLFSNYSDLSVLWWPHLFFCRLYPLQYLPPLSSIWLHNPLLNKKIFLSSLLFSSCTWATDYFYWYRLYLNLFQHDWPIFILKLISSNHSLPFHLNSNALHQSHGPSFSWSRFARSVQNGIMLVSTVHCTCVRKCFISVSYSCFSSDIFVFYSCLLRVLLFCFKIPFSSYFFVCMITHLPYLVIEFNDWHIISLLISSFFSVKTVR